MRQPPDLFLPFCEKISLSDRILRVSDLSKPPIEGLLIIISYITSLIKNGTRLFQNPLNKKQGHSDQ